MKYPKIQTLFLREEPGKGRKSYIIEGRFAKDEFRSIKYWHVTEKLDGTNTRIILTKDNIEIKGRTDNAQFNPQVLEFLKKDVAPKLAYLRGMWDFEKIKKAVIFGETIGEKINGNPHKIKGHAFYVFDIAVITNKLWWLEIDTINGNMEAVGIKIVPYLGIYDNLQEIINLVRDGFPTFVREDEAIKAEGIVAKSYPQLFNRMGERVMFKLKHKDFRK